MSDDYMNTRKEFLMAAASYFGLPEGQLMETSSVKDDAGTITVCLAVALTPRDMIGISKRMEAMAQMSNGIVTTGEEDERLEVSVTFSLEEEVKRTDKYQNSSFDGKLHPKIQEFRVAYNALTQAEKKVYGSRYNYVLARAKEEDEKAAQTQRRGDYYQGMVDKVANGQEDTSALQAYLDSIVEEARKKPLPVSPDALTGDGCLDDLKTPTGERQVVHIDTPEEPEPTNMDAVWLGYSDTTEAQRKFASDTNNSKALLEPEYLIQWAMLTDEQKQKAKP